MGKGRFGCGNVRYPGVGGRKTECGCWSRHLCTSGTRRLTRAALEVASLLKCIAAGAVMEKRLRVRFV